MRIAYLVQAHGQPGLFKRLARALDHPGNQLFVHVDARADAKAFAFAGRTAAVHFDPRPMNVNHAGHTQIVSMSRLLRRAIATGGFERVVFLSGQDYPLRRNDEIAEFFAASRDTNYINFYRLEGPADWVGNIRHRHYHDELQRLPGIMRKGAKALLMGLNSLLPPRPFPTGYIPYRGSCSWCLTAEAAQYIVRFIDDPAHAAFVRFFEQVFCPEEIIYQTILLNSPFAPTCRFYDRDVLRAAGKPALNENKAYLHYIDWTPGRENPALLDMSDLDAMWASDRLYARKFHEVKSAQVLDAIDARTGR